MSARWKRRIDRGFALLAVLLLVAILGIAAAAAVSAGMAIQRRANEEELLFVGTEFRNAFKSYYESAISVPRYPQKLEDLLRDPRFPGVRRHLRKLYSDPITGRADWATIPAPGGGILGVYSIAPGTPIKVALFEPEFAAFENKTSYADWQFAYVAPDGAPGGAQNGQVAGGAGGISSAPATGSVIPPAAPAGAAPNNAVPSGGAGVGR